MTSHNFDYAYIGLTCARIGSQLKEGYVLNIAASFCQRGNEYCSIHIMDEKNGFAVIRGFQSAEYETPQNFLDGVFSYCMENDLFKQPLDIKLVD